MASEIISTLISGGVGLVTGVIGSLAAPWANWGVEKRRLTRQRRAELLAEWRAGIDQIRILEDQIRPMIPVPGSGNAFIVADNGNPDPLEANIGRQNWYVSLKLQLSDQTRTKVEELRQKRVADRGESLPDLLAAEVARIETDWKLV
ncbi:hypothetical protein [Nocardia sp. NPDC020380]|uniref:hypothetical protein n=1 Tax=Nocardia sp. NPDC020380 TaxID=3364309 RepID=UPI003790C89E